MESNQTVKKVLVVEDEKYMREALVSWFNKEGYKVFAAKDGEEGLAMAVEEKPAIVLLDILMPKVNGFKMLEKLREDEYGKTVPVIMLTNFGDEDMIAQAKRLDVVAYMLKAEWSLKDIAAKVGEILAKK